MKTSKPLMYYRRLRRHGLRPRTACLSMLMWFTNKEDYHDRANRIKNVLNRFDQERERK